MRGAIEYVGRRVVSRRKFEVKMPADAEGYVGRTCPKCRLFFKVKSGTGIAKEHPQRCPGCGHLTEQMHFFTRAQMAYARAIASRMHDMADANMVESLITGVLERRIRRGAPPGEFDEMLRRAVPPKPSPKFREPSIADKYLCPSCLLRYAVETPPKFCPDCGEPPDPPVCRADAQIRAGAKRGRKEK